MSVYAAGNLMLFVQNKNNIVSNLVLYLVEMGYSDIPSFE